jgi:aminoglycoside phosphotransferase (APT) family kinase protein
VRSIDTRGRVFARSGRGGDLRSHDTWMEACFQHSEELLDVPRVRRIWANLRDLPRTASDVMTHGDLIPGNVLVANGRLVGVIDVGGLGPADPALDLVGAWHLLEGGPRRALREDLASDDLEWARGRAWAFEQAMGVICTTPTATRPCHAWASAPSRASWPQPTFDAATARNTPFTNADESSVDSSETSWTASEIATASGTSP